MNEYVCDECGEKFDESIALATHVRTHSRRKKVECDWCGKTIERRKSQLKGKENHFCGRECHDKFQGKLDISAEKLERLYWEKGMSLREIAEKFGVSQSQIYKRVKKEGIPRRSQGRRPIDVDLEFTPNLTYILGVMKGDGHIRKEKGTGKIVFKNLEKGFAEEFMKSLKEIGLNPNLIEREDERYSTGCYYLVEARSTKFYDWYTNLTQEDIENLVLKDSERTRKFLKGVYESDGYLTNGSSLNNYRLGIVNTNKNLIDTLKSCLKELDFNFALQIQEKNRRKDLFNLRISSFEEVSRFLDEINPCIKNHMEQSNTHQST